MYLLRRAFFIVIFIRCVLCHVELKCDKVQATVFQRLQNQGFNREIVYTIKLNAYSGLDLWSHGGCSMSIEQLLPSGAYVNKDELQDLSRHNKLHACPIGLVDVEKPKHMSRPTTVHMYSPVTSPTLQLTLPIHLRYHLPKAQGGYSTVKISQPWVLLRCPNNIFKMCLSRNTVQAPCASCSSLRCAWHNITLTALTDTLEMSVPVGDMRDFSFISTASCLASFCGCFYVIINMVCAIMGNKSNPLHSLKKKAK